MKSHLKKRVLLLLIACLGLMLAVRAPAQVFTVLHSFAGNDGAIPLGSLILSGNTLYGTASEAGPNGYGTVFSISFAPQLAIIPSGGNFILMWPTNVAGFSYSGYTLQFTTNPVSTNWNNVSPAPVVVNGQYTVTNPISGTQQFYRLSQ